MESSANESRRQFVKVLGLGAAGMALNLGNAAHGQDSQPAKKEIPRVAFGKSGLNVPVVVFGAMGISSSNANVLRAGVQSGLVMIDTAQGYKQGESERVIGEIVKAVGRENVMLHTKASGFPQDRLMEMTEQEAYDELRRCVDESLSRLGGDYIDTYVAPHGASKPEIVTAPALRSAVEKLKQEGKIKYFGVSTHTNFAACCMAAINSGWHDFIMPSIAISNVDPELLAGASGETASADNYEQQTGKAGRRRPKRNKSEDLREVLSAAQEKGVGVLAMKAVGYVPGNMMAKIREKYAPAGSTLSDQQICYRAVMMQPGVSTVTIGIQTMQHLEEALALPWLELKQA